MKLIVVVFLLGLTLSSALHAKTVQGVVTHVSDGDTLSIRTSMLSKPIKVRIQDIDAPEICQDGGRQARDALRERLLKQNVSVKIRATDDFGRKLGRVEHTGQDVGQWLVSEGHAWSYSFQRRPGAYANEQTAAKSKRLGLWRVANAQEPRAFRKQYGPCKR